MAQQTEQNERIQPFSQKSLTATVPKVFQIGLCGVVEADLELFCNSWSVEFLGERLYAALLITWHTSLHQQLGMIIFLAS